MNEISKILDDFFSSYMPSLSSSLRENRLERMHLLLKRIGNPERFFSVIHVAGSKGKGTVSTALSILLSQSGIKSGLFLSPHVYDIRERFTLSSVFFSDSEYLSALAHLKASISDFSFPSFLGPERPTTFELYTAYSYLLFKETGCKMAVIETGLGGRLDATNTLIPIASVITNIELEHTEILGNTLEQIAREKAGIIKYGIPSFVINQKENVLAVFKQYALENNSELNIFTLPVINRITEDNKSRVNFLNYTLTLRRSGNDIELVDTLYALAILDKLNLIKPLSSFDFTLPSVSLPGRMEERTINGRTIILDGAHTPSSMAHLRQALETRECETLVFSSSHDKPWKEIASSIVPLFKKVIVTDTGKWKKSYPEKIYDDIIQMFPDKEIYLIRDKKKIIKMIEKSTLTVVTGSFYLLGEIDSALKEAQSGD